MTTVPRPSSSGRWALAVAVVYLALHLPYLAPSLEDIDSINFALGLHDYDVGRHQPHPPGYPVYIAMGRVARWIVSPLSPDAARTDALVLALWSAVGGMIAILGAARLFGAVETRFGAPGTPVSPIWPVALMAVSPLFWMSGLRPMSDMPGLAAVLWSQALLVEGFTVHRALVAGGFLAGVAGGIRIQTLALTTPLLLASMVWQLRAGMGWRIWRPLLATTVGVLTWAVPLMLASGGIAAYLAALNTQAGEDFAFVDMLWSNPTLRRLAFALNETFALPWASPPLAHAMCLAAGVGGIVAGIKAPRALALVVLAFLPYGVYHLIFQETLTVRYALPLIPFVAWLVSRVGMVARPVRLVVAGLLVAAAAVALQGGIAYGSEAHPAYRAIHDAMARARTSPPARVLAHFGLRRSLQHGAVGLPFVEPRRQYEWLGAVEYWRGGGTGPVWFFADPKRTDLALIDPASRLDVGRYSWKVAERGELGGARPSGVDWYRISQPEWFLGEGWSLTPEAGGITRAAASGPVHRVIEGWVRRHAHPSQLMIGGLHLGGVGESDVALRLTVDDSVVDAWVVRAGESSFLRFVALPCGSAGGTSPYATVRVEGQATNGGGRPEVGIRQFDFRPSSGVLWGFGEGWYEAEYQPETGASWRWTSERSAVELRGTPQPVTLKIRGESPLKYFADAPTLRVTGQGRTLREVRLDSDFDLSVAVPEDVWRDGAARVVLELDRAYLPGVVEGTADTRRLGLRVFSARIDTQLP